MTEVALKLRVPVALRKKAEPTTELVLKPAGRALRGLSAPFGKKGERLFQRIPMFELALAGLRMAGVDPGYTRAVAGAMHSADVYDLHNEVMALLYGVGEEDEPEAREEETERADAVVVELRHPVQFGKAQPAVGRFTMLPTGSALRGLDYLVSVEGDLQLMHADIHDLAVVGIRMGKVVGDEGFVDLMHPRDVWEVSQKVLGFIQGGTAGSGASPS